MTLRSGKKEVERRAQIAQSYESVKLAPYGNKPWVREQDISKFSRTGQSPEVIWVIIGPDGEPATCTPFSEMSGAGMACGAGEHIVSYHRIEEPEQKLKRVLLALPEKKVKISQRALKKAMMDMLNAMDAEFDAAARKDLRKPTKKKRSRK